MPCKSAQIKDMEGVLMIPKGRSKDEKGEGKIPGILAYNMGHILYMAKLTGNMNKKNLIDSTPKHERERYKMAFETLVKDKLMIKVQKGKNKGNFQINPKKAENAKELIHGFIAGTTKDKNVKQIPKNPFFHRGPIKNIEHFIGRYELISHIFDRLRHTEDCSIIGPRAIGKTSLLHHISNEEAVKKHRLDPRKYIFIYYDLEGFGEDTQVKDFYYEMFSRTLSQINLSGLIKEEEIKIINKESGNVFKKIGKSLFEIGDLEALISALSERDYRIIYMLDEFEYLANNPTFDFSFYGQLRAFSGNPAFNVAFVTASKRSIYDLTFVEEVKTSPFFRYFEDFRLGPMSREEIRGFFDLAAVNGVVFSSEMKTLVEEWSGGHPFLAQLACDYFFDLVMNEKKLESKSEEKHLGIFLKKHQKHFAYFWKQMNEPQQGCLKKLASGENLGSGCKVILGDLEENYLLVRKDENYQIFSRAFEKFVRDMPSVKS
jgi:AAA+ ATPase superfamily predicted ATPase